VARTLDRKMNAASLSAGRYFSPILCFCTVWMSNGFFALWLGLVSDPTPQNDPHHSHVAEQ
jgi:hypothetical protein